MYAYTIFIQKKGEFEKENHLYDYVYNEGFDVFVFWVQYNQHKWKIMSPSENSFSFHLVPIVQNTERKFLFKILGIYFSLIFNCKEKQYFQKLKNNHRKKRNSIIIFRIETVFEFYLLNEKRFVLWNVIIYLLKKEKISFPYTYVN